MSHVQLYRLHPLPVTVVPGMTVVEAEGATSGAIVGITQAYCIYQLPGVDTLSVARWQDLALGNICPATPLLPTEVEDNDRRNGSASLLGELVALKRLDALTPKQFAAYDELVTYLCGD